LCATAGTQGDVKLLKRIGGACGAGARCDGTMDALSEVCLLGVTGDALLFSPKVLWIE